MEQSDRKLDESRAREMVRVRGFVRGYDRLDWLVALGLASVAWTLLTVLAVPIPHPGTWGGLAVAAGLRPPEAPVTGLGIGLARALFARFGLNVGMAVLVQLGHLAGAAIVGFSYLLMRRAFAPLLSLRSEELAALSLRSRLLTAAGAFVFGCSEAIWQRMQLLTDDLLRLFMGIVAIVAFDRFRRRRRLGWHCLCAFATGVLSAETPVGLVLAALFYLWNKIEKRRYWERRKNLKVIVRDPNDKSPRKPGEKADAVVSFDAARANDPLEFFDDEVEDEIRRVAEVQEKWLAALVFVVGLVATLTFDGLTFAGLGGLEVDGKGMWHYPVALVVSWYRGGRPFFSVGRLLISSVFTLFPFLIARAILPLATDVKDKFAMVASLFALVTGAVAWTQVSPFAGCWCWTWEISRMGESPVTLRAVMAFFAAGAVTAAFQAACCASRSQIQGSLKLMVEEGAALVRARRFCRWLLAAVAATAVVLAANGRRQPAVVSRLELIDEYVKTLADQVRGLQWVFTDGVLDDFLALELRSWGEAGPRPLSMTAGRSPYHEHVRLNASDDEEDRKVLRVGTLEALRFWAAERKDRLTRVALQLGYEVLVKCRVAGARSAGLVLRVGTPADDAAFDRDDAEADALCEKALASLTRPSTLSGGFDPAVSEKADFILWRLARMAELKAKKALLREDGPAAARQRDLADRLDRANGPYLLLKNKLERLDKDGGIVLSPQEGLSIALKRADFNLARPYANRMLKINPDDINANFAIGMWAIENHLYGVAQRYLEVVNAGRPDEPSVLNNLAMVRFKLGDVEEALSIIEQAARANPSSKEIQLNRKRIREAADRKERTQ